MLILVYSVYILHFPQNYTVLKLFQFIYGILSDARCCSEAWLLLTGCQGNAVPGGRSLRPVKNRGEPLFLTSTLYFTGLTTPLTKLFLLLSYFSICTFNKTPLPLFLLPLFFTGQTTP